MTYYFIEVFNSGYVSEGHTILEESQQLITDYERRMHTERRYDESRDVKEMIGELFISINQRNVSAEQNGGLFQLG